MDGEELFENTVRKVLTTITLVQTHIGTNTVFTTMLAHDEQGGISGAAAFKKALQPIKENRFSRTSH